MERLSDKARIYARAYGQPPYGRETEGTAELLIQMADKLAEYEDLEEQGKLWKLPCAVGDTVWDNDFGRPCSYEVTGFSFGNLNDGFDEEMELNEVLVHYTDSDRCVSGRCPVSEIGKTVFLTKQSAEQALKEMEGQ